MLPPNGIHTFRIQFFHNNSQDCWQRFPILLCLTTTAQVVVWLVRLNDAAADPRRVTAEGREDAIRRKALGSRGAGSGARAQGSALRRFVLDCDAGCCPVHPTSPHRVADTRCCSGWCTAVECTIVRSQACDGTSLSLMHSAGDTCGTLVDAFDNNPVSGTPLWHTISGGSVSSVCGSDSGSALSFNSAFSVVCASHVVCACGDFVSPARLVKLLPCLSKPAVNKERRALSLPFGSEINLAVVKPWTLEKQVTNVIRSSVHTDKGGLQLCLSSPFSRMQMR